MSDPIVNIVRRTIEESKNQGGMIAGMPKVTIDAGHAERLCVMANRMAKSEKEAIHRNDLLIQAEEMILDLRSTLNSIYRKHDIEPVSWEDAKHTLSVLMCGFAARGRGEGTSSDAAEQVLEVAAEDVSQIRRLKGLLESPVSPESESLADDKEWTLCSDRLPTMDDADPWGDVFTEIDGEVQKGSVKLILECADRSKSNDVWDVLWKPTGFRLPKPSGRTDSSSQDRITPS